MPYFKVKDLMINVVDDRLKTKWGGNMLCTQDQPTIDVCGRLSPYMHAVNVGHLVERSVELARELARDPNPDAIAGFEHAAAEIGTQLVANAAVGGGAMLPDPNCGGTSLETIPTPITPVVSRGNFLSANDLFAIKARAGEIIEAVDEMTSAYEPRGKVNNRVVTDALDGAREGRGARGAR